MKKEKVIEEIHFLDKDIFPFFILKKEIGEEINSEGILKHFHKAMEINFFKKAEGIYIIEKEAYKIENDTIIIIPSGMLHECKPKDSKKEEVLTYIFDLERIFKFCSEKYFIKYLNPLLTGEVCIVKKISKKNKGFKEIKESLEKLKKISKIKEGYELRVQSELLKLIAVLYESNLIINKKNKRLEIEINKIEKNFLLYIEENYNKKISKKDVCNYLGISEATFTRNIKKISGKTYVEYLKEYRLRKSIEFLTETELKITEISLEIGMEEVSYFIKCFKKAFGCSPNEYRKRFKK